MQLITAPSAPATFGSLPGSSSLIPLWEQICNSSILHPVQFSGRTNTIITNHSQFYMDTCDPLLFCNVRFRLNVVTVPIQWTKSSTGHEKQINKSLGTDPKMAGMLKVVYKN